MADAYERGRPEYAAAVVGALAAELELAPGAPVLDLAAGTGKLTRRLVAGGFDVVAIEPQASLRDRLSDAIGAERVREGFAEAIPLPDASVDAVTVADAFHWFEPAQALAEIRRVLTPGGGLAVLATYPDWSGASWADELGKEIMSLRPEHPHFDGPPWQEAVRAAGGWTPLREIRVTTSQRVRPEQIVDHVASMSWIAGLPDGQRADWLAHVTALVASGETPTELPLHVVVDLTTLT